MYVGKALTHFSLAAMTLAMPLVLHAATAQAQTLTGAAGELTPEEKAERETRKACKVQICAALHNRKTTTDLACDVVKTWRVDTLDAITKKAGVSWPWGKVMCKAPIKLKADMLTKALAGPKIDADIGQQSFTCEIHSKDGKEPPSEIKAEFSPKVTFESGKATRASLNWGKIDAPTLVKGAMWTATATDNTFNVLSGMIVDDINQFATTGCDEVKDEWQGK
jgi:hypothetical protein